MKRPNVNPDTKHRDSGTEMPRHDYENALKSAVSWLGDRYLLAEPVARLKEERKAFYFEPRQWYEARRPSRRTHH